MFGHFAAYINSRVSAGSLPPPPSLASALVLNAGYIHVKSRPTPHVRRVWNDLPSKTTYLSNFLPRPTPPPKYASSYTLASFTSQARPNLPSNPRSLCPSPSRRKCGIRSLTSRAPWRKKARDDHIWGYDGRYAESKLWSMMFIHKKKRCRAAVFMP